eukprot:Opistho-2@33399
MSGLPPEMELLKQRYHQELNELATRISSLERQLASKNIQLDRAETDLRETRMQLREVREQYEGKPENAVAKKEREMRREAERGELNKTNILKEIEELRMVDMKRKKESEDVKAELSRCQTHLDNV